MMLLITVYFILGTMVEVEYVGEASPVERKLVVMFFRIFWPLALLISERD